MTAPTLQSPSVVLRSITENVRRTDLEQLRTHNPMYDATIEQIDGRRIRVGQHWLADFASCNFLGFDLEPPIIDPRVIPTCM